MAQTCAETSHSAPGRLTLLDLHTAEKCRLLDEAAGRDDDDGRVGGSGLGIGTGLPNRLAHGSDRPTVEIEVRNDRRLHSARTAPTWEWVRSATFFVARIRVNHEQSAETSIFVYQGDPMRSAQSAAKRAKKKAGPAKKKASPVRRSGPAKKKAGLARKAGPARKAKLARKVGTAKKAGPARKIGLARKAGPAKKKAGRARKAA